MKTIANYFDGLGFPASKEFTSLNNAHGWAYDAGVFDKTTFTSKTMKIETHTMPALWASALGNGDLSGLNDADQSELESYLRANPEHANPVSCSEEPTLERFNGLLTECLEYSFLRGE